MIDDLIIFLDFDGVVNTPIWREYSLKGTPEFKCRFAFPEDGFVNNFQACCWLNELYKKYPYKIVVTSSWAVNRSVEELASYLYNGGLNREIDVIDKVDQDLRRTHAVQKWINDHSCKYFIIFDDENYYDSWFESLLVQTESNSGITLNEFSKAEDLIEKLKLIGGI